MHQLTADLATKLPRKTRAAIEDQCDGEWGRVVMDGDASWTVYNNSRRAWVVVQSSRPAQAVSEPPRPVTVPAASLVPTLTTSQPGPTPGPRPGPRPGPPPSTSSSTVQQIVTVELPPVPEPEPEAQPEPAPVEPPISFDWSALDLDGTVNTLRNRLANGLPANVKYAKHPEVQALYGIDDEAVEASLRHPQRVEIRPETVAKQYPVLGFHRGDVLTILGMRDPNCPMVIAIYMSGAFQEVARSGRTGGGGARKTTGLPHTIPAMLSRLREKGAVCEPQTSEAAATVTYKGQDLGKVQVVGSSRQQVESDYQRTLRRIDAIDRRVLVG